MNCRYLRARLSAYVDGELPGSEMLALRSHLSRCEACSREETELRAVKRLMGAMPVPVPPDGLEERLLRAVRTKKARVFVWHRFALAPLAAACVVLVAIGVITSNHPDRTPPTSAKAQAPAGFDLSRDQAYASGSDPLSLGPMALPAGYAKR